MLLVEESDDGAIAHKEQREQVIKGRAVNPALLEQGSNCRPIIPEILNAIREKSLGCVVNYTLKGVLFQTNVFKHKKGRVQYIDNV